MSRIARRFADLKSAGRPGLVTFIAAGDPDLVTAQAILDGLPKAGADLIELGMPFTDPMADGPAIQEASIRALKSGATLTSTLSMVERFRAKDDATPIVLMGYYNPIHSMGPERFCAAAAKAGVDGMIVVDLPPEEAEELAGPARAHGLDFIFLTAPTTDEARLPKVVATASGFLYYVSITGITGTTSAKAVDIGAAVKRLRRHTSLPIAVGFGVKTAQQVAEIGRVADAAVVGSAIVARLAANLDAEGRPLPSLVPEVLGFVAELATGTRDAMSGTAQATGTKQ